MPDETKSQQHRAANTLSRRQSETLDLRSRWQALPDVWHDSSDDPPGRSRPVNLSVSRMPASNTPMTRSKSGRQLTDAAGVPATQLVKISRRVTQKQLSASAQDLTHARMILRPTVTAERQIRSGHRPEAQTKEPPAMSVTRFRFMLVCSPASHNLALSGESSRAKFTGLQQRSRTASFQFTDSVPRPRLTPTCGRDVCLSIAKRLLPQNQPVNNNR